MDQYLENLQNKLGYVFVDSTLLERAMTHSTYANEFAGECSNNERLEFLGDAVLGVMVAHVLLEAYGEANEGELSLRRSRLVNNRELLAYAEHLSLGACLRVGKGQRNADGTLPASVLADAFEALAGAVYLDGGLDSVQRCFRKMFEAAVPRVTQLQDEKTKLQQHCHRLGLDNPVYEVVRSSGPAHAPTFVISVSIGEQNFAEAQGASKSAAQQVCAKIANGILEEEYGID